MNQQRAMHCSFVEQQKLLALKNEEKLFHMQLKGIYPGLSVYISDDEMFWDFDFFVAR